MVRNYLEDGNYFTKFESFYTNAQFQVGANLHPKSSILSQTAFIKFKNSFVIVDRLVQ